MFSGSPRIGPQAVVFYEPGRLGFQYLYRVVTATGFGHVHDTALTVIGGMPAKPDAFIGAFNPELAGIGMGANPHQGKDVSAAARRNAVGHTLGQGLGHHLGRNQGRPQGKGWRRRLCVHDAAFRGDHLQRPEVAFIRGGVRGGNRLEDQGAYSFGRANRYVHRTFTFIIRPGPVDGHFITGNGYRGLQAHLAVPHYPVIIDIILRGPGAVRQLRQSLARQTLAMVQHLFHCFRIGLNAKLFHQFLYPPLTGAARGNLCIHIADDPVRHTTVKSNQLFQFLIQYPFRIYLGTGENQSFLGKINGVQAITGVLLPQVQPVLFHGSEPHQIILVKDGRCRHDVQGMG